MWNCWQRFWANGRHRDCSSRAWQKSWVMTSPNADPRSRRFVVVVVSLSPYIVVVIVVTRLHCRNYVVIVDVSSSSSSSPSSWSSTPSSPSSSRFSRRRRFFGVSASEGWHEMTLMDLKSCQMWTLVYMTRSMMMMSMGGREAVQARVPMRKG